MFGAAYGFHALIRARKKSLPGRCRSSQRVSSPDISRSRSSMMKSRVIWAGVTRIAGSFLWLTAHSFGAFAGGAHPQHVDVGRGRRGVAQAQRGLGCDQVGLAQAEDDAVLAAVQVVEAAGSPVVLELLQRRIVGVAEHA